MQTEAGARLRHRWRLFAEDWPSLSWYQRFESLVAFALTLIVSLVIGVALYRLIVGVVSGLLLGALNPLDHSVFQETSAIELLSLAAATLALGITYGLIPESAERRE
jgi:hypothetical protein